VDTYAAILTATPHVPVTLPSNKDLDAAKLILQLLLQRPDYLPRVIVPAVRVPEFINALCSLPASIYHDNDSLDKSGQSHRGRMMQVVSWLAGQDWQHVRWSDPCLETLEEVRVWDDRLNCLENGQLGLKCIFCSPFARIHARFGAEGLLRVLRRLDIQLLSKELLFLALRSRQPELLQWLYKRGFSKTWGVLGEVVAVEWLCETERESMLTALVAVARRDGRKVEDWTRLLMERDPELASLAAVYFDAA